MTRFKITRNDKKKRQQIPKRADNLKGKICSYYKCGKEAIGKYTFDLDIDGLNFCKKHKSDIGSALIWCILGVRELAEHAIGHPAEKIKKKKQR